VSETKIRPELRNLDYTKWNSLGVDPRTDPSLPQGGPHVVPDDWIFGGWAAKTYRLPRVYRVRPAMALPWAYAGGYQGDTSGMYEFMSDTTISPKDIKLPPFVIKRQKKLGDYIGNDGGHATVSQHFKEVMEEVAPDTYLFEPIQLLMEPGREPFPVQYYLWRFKNTKYESEKTLYLDKSNYYFQLCEHKGQPHIRYLPSQAGKSYVEFNQEIFSDPFVNINWGLFDHATFGICGGIFVTEEFYKKFRKYKLKAMTITAVGAMR